MVEMFSPEDKLFMLYLMTNPHTTQLGIYSLNKKIMAFELGYSLDTISVLIERFENKYDIIRYSKETNEMAVKNSLRHSIVKGGAPVRDCLIKEIKAVKNKELLKYVFRYLKQYELNTTVAKLIDEYEEKHGELLYCNDNKNEKENENDNDVSYHDSYNDSYHDSSKPHQIIIDYLNEKADKKYMANNKVTQKHINARLKEGYTVEDFKSVIDKKCAEWKNTEMEQYLRPETLFGTKFEGYLNAKNNKKGSEDNKSDSGHNSENEYAKWVTGGTVL